MYKELFFNPSLNTKFTPLPAKSSPLYLQLTVLLAYAIVARELFYMERPHWITLASCASAILTDFILGVFVYKVIRFPVAAVIIGLACSLLIDSRFAWVYCVATSFAVISKAFITHNKKHYFNPANFGVVMALLIIPYHSTAMPTLFAGYLLPSVIFAVIGLITILYANQLAVPFAWLVGFFFFAYLRANFFGSDFLYNMSPALSPTFLLFTFHMISDPATTPKSTKYRILFGILVALIDSFFRLFHVPYGNFYALFIMGAFLPFIRKSEKIAHKTKILSNS